MVYIDGVPRTGLRPWVERRYGHARAHAERDPSDEHAGVFTSGGISIREGRRIALYFTGSQHTGENLAEVLKRRSRELPRPIQMCGVLSRNAPKLPAGRLCVLNEIRNFDTDIGGDVLEFQN